MKKVKIIGCALLIAVTLHAQQAMENIGKKVDDYLSGAELYGFSGAIIVAKDGQILLNKGYGYAHRTTKTVNTPSSVFSTGSVTKQFTAAAVMKLEMMGKLNTEDKLPKYFDNVPDDKKNITIHHLLTHTAGLPPAVGNDFDPITKGEFIEKVMAAETRFPPGDDFAYSNVGYSLLALIIEKQSKLRYEAFLRKYLFGPAGMQHTGYGLPNWDDTAFAHIYNGDNDNGSTRRFTKPTWHLMGNGGILSTTGDMYKWVEALKNNTVLNEEATRKMFVPFKNNYAYGWDAIDGGNLRQHDGGSTLGNSAELRWFVEEDLLTMLFTNATINGNLGFSVVRDDIEALTFGIEIPLPPKIHPVARDLEPYIGTYQFPSGQTFSISGDAHSIYLEVDNQELYDLLLDPDNYKPGGVNIVPNKKIEKAFERALSDGDFQGFEFIGASATLQKEISTEIEMEGMTKPNYKLIKTVPSQHGDNRYITQVALSDDKNFEGESMILSIVTENFKFAGLGIDFGSVSPLKLQLYPIAENKFQAYSLQSKMGARIEIVGKSDNNYDFTVGNTTVSYIKKKRDKINSSSVTPPTEIIHSEFQK
ncbi:CubicO group peptidase, beta-lactamase class C family [Saccharicrinis carchari]|uniref:CubicO group peptidase, beta-lactamase class C family n=1 Tax=Saccharicrinis carchari TaxID=1168039 RepID=A0A521ECF6_SACCC|nr:serine hydrolase domain-containing protein [Saccharicrinis carchari]SMO81605.1 CubicO group peptidase, beta-lactamase class C family [Saccharicrinis carchari]